MKAIRLHDIPIHIACTCSYPINRKYFGYSGIIASTLMMNLLLYVDKQCNNQKNFRLGCIEIV